MEEIVAKLPTILEQVSIYLSVLVVIATALVRLPPLAKHSDKVDGVVGFLNKILKWMPTIGVNPQTKKLEEKVKGS